MDKYERALNAIRDVYSDTSEESEDTKQDLQSLRDEIQIMIETL